MVMASEAVSAPTTSTQAPEQGQLEQAPPQPPRPQIVAPSRKDTNGVVSGPVPHILDAATGLTPTLQRFRLDGKVAVVTGGARGLGFNMACALCECGVKAIAILDILEDHGEDAIAQLHSDYGVAAAYYKIDVRNEEAVKSVMESIKRNLGSVDVLLCSAGIADSNIKAEEYPIDKFRRLIDINLTGSFICAQAAAQIMIEQQVGGSIIFIASMSGHIVNFPQQQSCYNASKAGVIHLMKSLAAEWAQYKIRCNSISPGYMDTALNRVPALEAQKTIWKSRTPQERLGEVWELNNTAVFLASDASSFMTGSDLVIDGGYCCW